MAKVKPITPEQVGTEPPIFRPNYVIAAFNEWIETRWNGTSSTFTIPEVIETILRKAKYSKKHNYPGLSRDDILQWNWLDVERFYRAAGWEVEYKSLEATFVFTKRTR